MGDGTPANCDSGQIRAILPRRSPLLPATINTSITVLLLRRRPRGILRTTVTIHKVLQLLLLACTFILLILSILIRRRRYHHSTPSTTGNTPRLMHKVLRRHLTHRPWWEGTMPLLLPVEPEAKQQHIQSIRRRASLNNVHPLRHGVNATSTGVPTASSREDFASPTARSVKHAPTPDVPKT